jgi:hypothetical protein
LVLTLLPPLPRALTAATIPPQMIELDNYAKNKAVYILKCLREGTQPQPGPSAIGAADGAASAEPARIPSGPPASTDYGMPQVPSSRPSDSGYDYGMPQVPPSQPSGAFDFGLPEVPSSQPSQSFGGYGAPGGSASSPYGMPPTAPPAPAAVQPPTQPAPHFNPAPPQAFVPLSTPPPMMAVGTSFTPKASVTIAEENEVRPTLLKIRSRPPPSTHTTFVLSSSQAAKAAKFAISALQHSDVSILSACIPTILQRENTN